MFLPREQAQKTSIVDRYVEANTLDPLIGSKNKRIFRKKV
jgi:hypothetical protein